MAIAVDRQYAAPPISRFDRKWRKNTTQAPTSAASSTMKAGVCRLAGQLIPAADFAGVPGGNHKAGVGPKMFATINRPPSMTPQASSGVVCVNVRHLCPGSAEYRDVMSHLAASQSGERRYLKASAVDRMQEIAPFQTW